MAGRKKNNSKDLAEQLLKAKNKDYNEWLEEKHQELFIENSTEILDALKAVNN